MSKVGWEQILPRGSIAKCYAQQPMPVQTSRFMGGNYVMLHPATWALIGVLKTSRDLKKDCGKPGCPNDRRSQCSPVWDEVIE